MDRRYTEVQILTIRSKPHTTRPRPIAAPRMGPCEGALRKDCVMGDKSQKNKDKKQKTAMKAKAAKAAKARPAQQ